jgi:lysophospholipase L1-like esterase
MPTRASALAMVLVTILLVLLPPAHAAAPSYVALGDSYSSGLGTRTYLLDGTTCRRSVYAYPSLLASAKGYRLNLRACSGATVADVRRLQLPALSTTTRYVTVSAGGNDAGFTRVLTTCAEPWWLADCNGAVDRAEAYIRNTLPGTLASLYTAIRSRAPSATVVVVGYPRLFDGTDCNALTWFSPSEMTRLNAAADLLDATTSSAAAAAGFAFANPTRRFTGHAVCDSPEWINGLSNPPSESYHPNIAGHRDGYLPLVSRLLTGTAVTASTATLAAARDSAARLTLQQRAHADQDRAIEPERFLAPDPITAELTRPGPHRRAGEQVGAPSCAGHVSVTP